MWLMLISRHLMANINGVTSGSAGEYGCVMPKGQEEKRLKQTISVPIESHSVFFIVLDTDCYCFIDRILYSYFRVVKTVEPYHAQSDPRKLRILYYGRAADFDCIIEGTPRRDFK
ncbi:hypothetical protein GCK32_014265 [Trichostrongylus colubriformis]|uniref:Uncharacterized protein n=1 Tax=Trichostrongylus colubriformis TaxID=6319 RepID=A0AAN8FLR9_TRICO